MGAYETIINKGNPAVEFDDGAKTIQLLHTIYRSAEIGDWVKVSDGLESDNFGQPNEEISSIYRTKKPA